MGKICFVIILFISCFPKKEFLIKVERKGGFAGFNEEILIKNKLLIYKDKKLGIENHIKISDDKIKRIREFLEKIKEEKEIVGEPFPDCIIHEINFKINGKMKRIIFYQKPSSIESNLDEFLKFLNEIIEEVKGR